MKNIFHKNAIKYLINYFLVFIINILFIFMLNNIIPPIDSIISWFLYVIIFAIIVSMSLFIIYFISFRSFKLLVNRGIEYVKVFFNKRTNKTT